jgi:hypothetical protein
MQTIASTKWIPELSKELKGYPSLAIKMTAMRLAPKMGLAFADEMPADDAAKLRDAVRDQIKTVLAEAKRRAR